MQSRRRTRAAMQFSRGLILGRILTGFRHLLMGLGFMSLVGLTLSGHLGMAIGLVVGMYLCCKACDALTALLRGKPACR